MRLDRMSSARALRLLPLAALAGLLIAVAPGATASSTTTFTASADAYLNSAKPTQNYNSSPLLRADGSPATWSLVRFDVSGLSGPVAKATLQVFSSSGSTAGFDVRPVASSWNEQSVVWNGAPAYGGAIGSSGAFAAGAWTSADVTSAIHGDGTYSFALTGRSATNLSLVSSEGGKPPKLVIVTSDGTSSSSTTTTSPPSPSSSTTTSSSTSTSTSATVSTSTTAPTSTTTTSSPPPPPPSYGQPSFPIRAAFYYPWFPEAWKQQGMDPFTHYSPTGGFYDESQTATEQRQISDLRYAGMDAAIASWWGQGSNSDGRLGSLLSETMALGSPLKWAIYYEPEGSGDPSVTQIVSDLQYIQSRYASSPAYLKINGRFVVFVWAQATDGAAMALRWKQASDQLGHAAYIVLKVFNGYQSYTADADSWHQYGPAVAESSINGYSFTISPGFWKANESAPRLGRDVTRWRTDIADMIKSGAPWQLVTTYNEWGEGTAVESASQWSSPSGHGEYIDALHAALVGGTPVPSASSTSLSTTSTSTSAGTPPATTATGPDTLAPSAPAGLHVTASDQISATLAWTASTDNVGVSGYALYLNGGKVGTSAQTSYRFTSLNCGGSYTLEVDAYDAAGNHSTVASITTATAPCFDGSAPATPTGLHIAAADQTSAGLGWTASTDNVAVVGYTLYLNGAKAGTSSQTSYTFAGLSCGQSYTLGVDAYDAAGNHSAAATTTTATAPCSGSPPPADPTIAAAGDISCDPSDSRFNGGAGGTTSCRELQTSDLLGNLKASGNLAGILTLGDDQYECGRASAFTTSFGPSWGRFKSIIHPAIGNHEYGASCGLNDATPYFDYFGSAAGPAGRGWYSYDIGSWHLIALNSECHYGTGSGAVGGCQAGSAQESWLRADLAAHSNACTLAYWHEPRFSSGEHGDAQQMATIWNDLVAAHVDVVLSGHNHDYERFDPLGATPQSSTATATPSFQSPNLNPSGIREFVVGTGGKNHYGFAQGMLAGEQVRNADTFGVLTLQLHSGGYEWKFLPEAGGGTFTDAGSGSCH